MKDRIEIWLFRFVKWVVFRGYGYCSKDYRDKDCTACKASWVQDWIDGHIELLEWDPSKAVLIPSHHEQGTRRGRRRKNTPVR